MIFTFIVQYFIFNMRTNKFRGIHYWISNVFFIETIQFKHPSGYSILSTNPTPINIDQSNRTDPITH